ncbi:MAG: hypothetical protein ABW184_04445 [Sphingobium sp.]
MPSSHTVVYHGEVLHILFETSTDLSLFMPDGLHLPDPHRAFVKVQRMKMRSPDADRDPPAFNHYQQIGVATMATTPQFGPRHRNFLLWEDRHWAIGSTMAGAKRYGRIEMTQLFETERRLVEEDAPAPFRVDVEANGFMLMRFAGMLDGVARIERPPYGGFYVGGEPGTDLLALTLETSEFSRPLQGTGELSFGSAPNERATGPGTETPWPATLLKDIRTLGCVLEDFTFTRTFGSEFTTLKAG